MDVKDLIKWLFQIKTVHNLPENSKAKSQNNACLSVVFVTLSIFSLVNSCNCVGIGNIKDISDSGVTNVDQENENKTIRRDLLMTNDSKSETTYKFNSTDIKNGFRDISNILKSLRYFEELLSENSNNHTDIETSRTFGRPIKKLQAMLIPMMFKAGVLSTLIVFTFLLALKGVVIGKIIMMLTGASLLASLSKLFLLKSSHGHDDLGKQVHLHIHNTGIPTHGSYYPIPSDLSTGHDSWNRRQSSYIADNNGFFHQTGLGASVINTPYGRYVRTGAPTAAGFKR